jgi:hypothetical protein
MPRCHGYEGRRTIPSDNLDEKSQLYCRAASPARRRRSSDVRAEPAQLLDPKSATQLLRQGDDLAGDRVAHCHGPMSGKCWSVPYASFVAVTSHAR